MIELKILNNLKFHNSPLKYEFIAMKVIVASKYYEYYFQVKSPQLFLPSQRDSPSVKKNGLGKQVLGDSVEIIEFPDMRHGWTVRGDLADPTIERDVKKAFNLVLDFFGKHL